MIASKRSIRKAQGVDMKDKQPKHNNRKITNGREHRLQIIKDEHGFTKKIVFHYAPRKLRKIALYNKAVEEYKAFKEAEAQAAQQEGENDVKGVEVKPEVIATE